MDDDREIRCPTCRSIDWYRDGLLMYELDDGAIVRERLADAADTAAPWSCATCAYEVPDTSVLRRRLIGASSNAADMTRVP